MVKLTVLARGPKEWTREQFIEWWRGPHARSAKKIPGLLGYTHGKILLDYDQPDAEVLRIGKLWTKRFLQKSG